MSVIDLQINGRIAEITLARADKRNAMSADMMDQLHAMAHDLSGNDQIDLIYLHGAGPAFCAGADLEWMQAQQSADRTGKMAEAKRLSNMLRALRDMRQPLVTYAHGAVFGGGLGLLAISDIVYLHKDTKLSFSETKLGLIPATIGPFVVRKIGTSLARHMFISAEIFDAERAHFAGLAHHMVEDEGQARAGLEQLQNNGPAAMAAAKSFVSRLEEDLERDIEHSIEQLADIWESAEAQDRIAAFLNKGKKP
ncbi:MAG: enoyl-CoA hydratase-related protein [Pseudomonadota bacterium]